MCMEGQRSRPRTHALAPPHPMHTHTDCMPSTPSHPIHLGIRSMTISTALQLHSSTTPTTPEPQAHQAACLGP
jgi:hypothetical protein